MLINMHSDHWVLSAGNRNGKEFNLPCSCLFPLFQGKAQTAVISRQQLTLSPKISPRSCLLCLWNSLFNHLHHLHIPAWEKPHSHVLQVKVRAGIRPTHQTLTYRNCFFGHMLFNHETWGSRVDNIFIHPEPWQPFQFISTPGHMCWCKTQSYLSLRKQHCPNSAGCFKRQSVSMWSHVNYFPEYPGYGGGWGYCITVCGVGV